MKDKAAALLKNFYLALIGTIIVAICCFTSVLVILLGLIGLSLLVPYLDYILFPLLFMFLILTVISFRKWYLMKKVN